MSPRFLCVRAAVAPRLPCLHGSSTSMRLTLLAFTPLILTACATAPALPLGRAADADAASALAAAGDLGALAPLPAAALLADGAPQGPPPPPRSPSKGWRPGEAALQGYIGGSFQTLSTEGGSIFN